MNNRILVALQEVVDDISGKKKLQSLENYLQERNHMIKRFLLFAGNDGETTFGGWENFAGAFTTEEMALAKQKKDRWEWYQIVDLNTMEIVDSFSNDDDEDCRTEDEDDEEDVFDDPRRSKYEM